MWHDLPVLALPLISLLAGLASLYIDPQKEPNKKWILVALLLLSAGGAVAGGLSDAGAKERAEKATETDRETINLMAKETHSVSGNTEDILAILRSSGAKSVTADSLAQTLSANTARNAILSTVRAGDSSKVTVVYYPKDVDGPVVVQALKEGGFQVENRQGNPANAKLPTNAIWVGSGVSLDQAKFVALTLTRAGVGIAAVRRFNSDTPAKKNLIEVGTDQSLKGVPALTAEQITALTDFQAGKGSATELAN